MLFLLHFFLALSLQLSLFPMEHRQLIKPNISEEKIEKWKQRALQFIGHRGPPQEPSEFLKSLCPDPVLKLHEELIPEYLLATEVAKKLQSYQPDQLFELLEKIINERYRDMRYPPGWRNYRMMTDITNEVYVYKRHACAIIIASSPTCPVNSDLLSMAINEEDFIMAKFLLERGVYPEDQPNTSKAISSIRNKYLVRLLHAYNWPLCSTSLGCIADKSFSPKFLNWCIPLGVNIHKHNDLSSLIYRDRSNLQLPSMPALKDKLTKCKMLIAAEVRITQYDECHHVIDYLKKCARAKENSLEQKSLCNEIINTLKSAHPNFYKKGPPQLIMLEAR